MPKMRTLHRYLGYFLAGIMSVYALSGIVLIFRDTDIFHKITPIEKKLPADTKLEDLGKLLELRRLKIERTEGDIAYFKEGTYNLTTHVANYSTRELPLVLEKMTELHKANSSKPLFFLNIFFGVSLLFFVISAFWMYLPQTDVFKKGMYFVAAGVLFALLLLWL